MIEIGAQLTRLAAGMLVAARPHTRPAASLAHSSPLEVPHSILDRNDRPFSWKSRVRLKDIVWSN